MIRYAICNETFEGWDWPSTCLKVAELGYDGIELAPFTLADDVRRITPSERRATAETAIQAGLTITGLHWLLVSPPGLTLTSDDRAAREETAAYLTALADYCADVGGKILVLGSPRQRQLPLSSDRPHEERAALARERLRDCLIPALDRAAERDVALCLEPLPPPEADFVLTLQEAVDEIRRIGHPALKTIFDVKSASSEGAPLPDLIRRWAPYVAHVHANDANRRGPGFGTTDFIPVLRTLAEIGYDGYVSVEVFDYKPDPVTIARESLAYMRQCEENG